MLTGQEVKRRQRPYQQHKETDSPGRQIKNPGEENRDAKKRPQISAMLPLTSLCRTAAL